MTAIRWKRWNEGDREGWEHGEVILVRKGRGSWTSWAMLHKPSMLGFAASWSRLRDAKAGAEKIMAEFAAPIGDAESLDHEEQQRLKRIIKTHRQFAG